MTRPCRTNAGFTLVEMLVATAVMLAVIGAVFQIMNPSHGMFQTQPEVADLQQRLRVGVDMLGKDLIMAGAGAYSGPQSGPLIGFFAPIQPSRHGSLAAYDDGPGVFKADAITIFYVPSTSSQTTLASALPNTLAALDVNSEPGCPQSESLCGFATGVGALVYDNTGSYDALTITDVQGETGRVQRRQRGDLSKAYGPGAKVVQMQEHVYYYDASALQLMHYDGFQAVAPVLDEVVGVNFEYYGEPAPPAMLRPNVDQSVTYGPSPPPLGVTYGDWPPGENCTIRTVEGVQVPRLAALGPPNGGPVLLTAASLTDGPWCPDGASGNRFDADLLRIRRVRVTLRVQTGNASLRGPATGGADALFVKPGTSDNGIRRVPDQQIRFDVAPRNMNLGR